jgi:hypothetical protein
VGTEDFAAWPFAHGDDAMRRLLAAVFVVAFIGMVSLAQADEKPNPTGTWKWNVNFGGQNREVTLKLKLDGDKLTGAIVRDGQETPIRDAKYKDGDLSFAIVFEANGQKVTIKKTGKLSGDTIKGKTEFERDGQARSMDWEAKRVVAANPTGTWKWTTTFNGQTRERMLKLKLENHQLTGVLVGRNGQETAIQDAKYKDGEVSFTVVRERNGQKITSKYTGKVCGDTIKGKMEFERQGQPQSQDWDAKRAKD